MKGEIKGTETALETPAGAGAWASEFSNQRGRLGWRAFATLAEAEADQATMETGWPDGIRFIFDAVPGEEWDG